jgi:hypothetical protein
MLALVIYFVTWCLGSWDNPVSIVTGLTAKLGSWQGLYSFQTGSKAQPDTSQWSVGGQHVEVTTCFHLELRSKMGGYSSALIKHRAALHFCVYAVSKIFVGLCYNQLVAYIKAT